LITLLQKHALAQEIKLGSPDHFSSWEGGVWGWDKLWPSEHVSSNRS